MAESVQVATASSSETQPEQQGKATTQWAYRSQKATGLRSGSPSYSPVTGFENLESVTSVFEYAPDGSIFAAALADCVRIVDSSAASSCSVKHDLPVPKVVALEFSPSGGYLSTWERPSKQEDGTSVKNLKIWNVQSGLEVASFERKSREGCFFKFTSNEKYCIRQVSTELQVYESGSISENGVIGRLRLEGMTSFEIGPGEKPSVAVFFGEKKGAPAAVRIYSLSSFVPSPETPPAAVSQKQFFKADKIQMKWNKAGTGLLFRTSTDVDKSNKSYDGESNLYMMSSRGDFDCRVGLDKEGPIHDFEWNPNSREFIVLFGFMPAKMVLFSYKVNVIKELGSGPRNFVAFNPQGRLFAIAGFGNLSGTVDIWDREKLDKGKITSMDASNSSVFQWSPDGHFILTATLSPRLRVENGVRIWHCTGKLVHVEMIDELYQASWRPGLNTSLVAFPSTLPEAPTPSATAAEYLATHKSISSKPSGAYRPPGARGLATPDIYKREDRDGSEMNSSPSSSGGGSRNRYVPGAPNGNSHSVPGAPRGAGRKSVPGAPASMGSPSGKKNLAPGAPPTSSSSASGKKKSKKPNGQAAEPSIAPAASTNAAAAVVPEDPPVLPVSGAAEVGGNAASIALEKKVRNLNKKLKAIAELKEKQAKGEKLEQTQISKINSEKEIRAELETLE